MAGYDNDYDGLKSLIIRDQFFITCDRQLQTFLKEKGTLSLKEMTKAANDFYEAHGYPSDIYEPSKRPNDNMKKPTLNSINYRNTQPHSVTQAGTRHCDNCGLNNHHTNKCRRLPLNTVDHQNTQPPSVTQAIKNTSVSHELKQNGSYVPNKWSRSSHIQLLIWRITQLWWITGWWWN